MQQSRTSLGGDHFSYSHAHNFLFNGDTARRNKIPFIPSGWLKGYEKKVKQLSTNEFSTLFVCGLREYKIHIC